MQSLWNRVWLDVPAYCPVPGSIRIRTRYARPLRPTALASGRVLERRWRKLAIFVVTDGPRATIQKARSKYEESRYLGDYHSALVTGTKDDGNFVIALATRVPRCATLTLVHERLAVRVSHPPSEAQLDALARRFFDDVPDPALLDDSYLYRGEPPPESLELLLRAVVRDGARGFAQRRSDAGRVMRPPRAIREDDLSARVALSSSKLFSPPAVCVLGAGDYARSVVIPELRRGGANLYCIVDREPQIAQLVGLRFGFQNAASDAQLAISELPAASLVIVATAHDSHAGLAADALRSGHQVFLEKPPVVTVEDLDTLLTAAERRPGHLEIGFNRRYAPAIRYAVRALSLERGPLTMTASIKEVPLTRTHWYLWPNQGTRVTGNLCHWIDLGALFVGREAWPEQISVSPAPIGSGPADEERAVSATFDDGSLITVVATNRGDELRGVQESIEVRRGDTTVWIDDLRRVRVTRGGIARWRRFLFRDKGHELMYRTWMSRVKAGKPSVYPMGDIARVSAIQIAASAAVAGKRLPEPHQLLESLEIPKGWPDVARGSGSKSPHRTTPVKNAPPAGMKPSQ